LHGQLWCCQTSQNLSLPITRHCAVAEERCQDFFMS
jgi:hypothetical protein